jgi:hypothetical protein
VWADGATEPTTWTWQGQDAALPTGSVGAYTYEPNTVDYDAFGYALQGGTAPTPTVIAPAIVQQIQARTGGGL